MSAGMKWESYPGEEKSPYRKNPTEDHSKPRWFWIFIATSFCVILILQFPWASSRDVPSELIGTWRTSDPNYADRFIEIDRGSVSFGTGQATLMNGFITKVATFREASRTIYTIFYANNGETGQCSLYFSDEEENTIHLKNQPAIAWVKEN